MRQAPQLESALFDLYGTTVDIEVDEDSPRLWSGLTAAFREMDVTVEPSDVRRRFQTFLHEEAERDSSRATERHAVSAWLA